MLVSVSFRFTKARLLVYFVLFCFQFVDSFCVLMLFYYYYYQILLHNSTIKHDR